MVRRFKNDLLIAERGGESRRSCGQYTVNDLPTFEHSAFLAILENQ